LRPPTEDMRARKPWLRARRSFEGWNVRFMADLSLSFCIVGKALH
jgi:hypothetical protein